MKGLIIKDMYVLKRNLPTFLFVTLGVMILGVMFVLSVKYGNIAKGLIEMKREPMGEETFFLAYQTAVWAVLILPLTFLTMVVECFKADGRADFYKVERSLPVSRRKVVGARYISSLLLSAISLLAALIAGYTVSMTTEVYSYQKIILYTLSIFCVLFLYNMLVFPFYYYFGEKRADVILGLPLIIGYFVFVFYFGFATKGDTDKIIQLFNNIKGLLTDYIPVLMGIVIGLGILSFWISCKIESSKGGNRR